MSKFSFCDELKNLIKNHQPELRAETDYTKSAVLLPLVETDKGTSILFEVRSSDLTWQPGEICFPGGRIEEDDVDAKATAIRETCEELALTPDLIEVYGPLDYLATQMGVLVFPYAGRILDIDKIKPSKDEVAEVFTAPIKELLAIEPLVAQIQSCTKPISDNFPYELVPEYAKGPRMRKIYDLYFFEYEKYIIWGMTARILKDFLDLYKENCSS